MFAHMQGEDRFVILVLVLFSYSGLSHSYSTKRDKHLAKLTKLTVGSRRFDERSPETPSINQGVITQLSEQISTLNERMDEFTSRIEELNCKFSMQKHSTSQQNLPLPGEACNGSAPTSLFMSSLGNGTRIPNSSSSTQLSKDSPLVDEIIAIARGQRQMIHQLDNLSNLLHEHLTPQLSRQKSLGTGRMLDMDGLAKPLILMLAAGGVGVGIFLLKGLSRS